MENELIRLTVLDDFQNVAGQFGNWDSLGNSVSVQVHNDHIVDDAVLIDRLRESFSVMCIRERTPLHRAILENLPNLRLICNTGMANPSIDLEAATELGIIVSGTQTSGTYGTAEITWALILAAARNVVGENLAVRQGKWQISVGFELRGKTLGLLGLGRIGAEVSKVGLAFGMRVIAWSENLTPERCEELGVTLVNKDALFQEADVLSIHLRLSARTEGIVGEREINLMKPSSLLINSSRGQIVEEPALIAALENGIIRGAGLDTFNIEPLPVDHDFRKLTNAVITPHLGYVSTESYESYYGQTIENIVSYLDGNPLRIMNPDVIKNGALRPPLK